MRAVLWVVELGAGCAARRATYSAISASTSAIFRSSSPFVRIRHSLRACAPYLHQIDGREGCFGRNIEKLFPRNDQLPTLLASLDWFANERPVRFFGLLVDQNHEDGKRVRQPVGKMAQLASKQKSSVRLLSEVTSSRFDLRGENTPSFYAVVVRYLDVAIDTVVGTRGILRPINPPEIEIDDRVNDRFPGVRDSVVRSLLFRRGPRLSSCHRLMRQ